MLLQHLKRSHYASSSAAQNNGYNKTESTKERQCIRKCDGMLIAKHSIQNDLGSCNRQCFKAVCEIMFSLQQCNGLIGCLDIFV